MSFTQTIARNLLSDRLYESLQQESQTWVMRCPCGAETSVWEMGGIRWKAAGEPRRMGTCRVCQRTFWGQVYRRAVDVCVPGDRTVQKQCSPDKELCATVIQSGDASQRSTTRGSDAPSTPANPTMTVPAEPIELRDTAAILLWIDGVGCWMVFAGERVTIGGPVEPGSSQAMADLCVLANLRRLHATIDRGEESYRLLTVDHDDAAYLRDGRAISLGGRLTMGFRIPSVLSQTAVLTPSAEPWPRMYTGDRTPASVDGVVLMDQVCLLGPDGDAHVPCRDWEQTVILFRRDGRLWCRSQGAIEVDGRPVTGGLALSDGSIVSGEGWRFRVEAVPEKRTSGGNRT